MKFRLRPTLAFLACAIVIAGLALVGDVAWAQDTAAFAREAGLGEQGDLRLLIARIIRTVLGFLGIIAILVVISGGLMWMAAGGDAKKIQKARLALINGVIGLVIVLASFGIATFVISRLAEVTDARIKDKNPCDPIVETCYNDDPLDPRGRFVLLGIN